MKSAKHFVKGMARRYGATHLEVTLDTPQEIAARIDALGLTMEQKKEAVNAMDRIGHPHANLVWAELFPLNA